MANKQFLVVLSTGFVFVSLFAIMAMILSMLFSNSCSLAFAAGVALLSISICVVLLNLVARDQD